MQLLLPLACGVAGAAAGSVDIYKRGTSTRATYYTAFDGSGATTPSASLVLDGNGSAVIYVNEPVDCVVRDATGQPIRTFTHASAASDVEVISQSFTGTSYGTGVSAASSPTTLSAILDLWRTQNGSTSVPAIDWKVVVNGTLNTIPTFLAGVTGLFFNVKDPTYGALGDGSTDDTTKIQAALTAAAINGGIVFFPPGTYRITANLSVGGNVDIWGCGPAASYVRQDTGSVDILNYVTGTKDWQTVQGLRLDYSTDSASNKTAIRIAGGTRLRIVDCYLGNSHALGGSLYMSNAAALSELHNCTIECGVSATNPIQTSSGKRVGIYGCRFVLPATFTSTVVNMGACDLVAVGNAFECGTVTVGTMYCIAAASGQDSYIAGNNFQAGGGAAVTAINFGSFDNIFEVGNRFGTGVTAYLLPTPGGVISHNGAINQSRDGRMEFIDAGSGASNVLHADQYGTTVMKITSAAAQTWQPVLGLYNGQRWTLCAWNTTGAPSGTITMSSTPGLASFTVNAGKASVYEFRAVEVNSILYWVLVGNAALNFTP